MKRTELVSRVLECRDILARSGVTDIEETIQELGALDGPGVSKRVKWMKAVERACIDEADVYKDQSPRGWENLRHLNPGSPDLKRLRALRVAVRKAWSTRD